ncbi:MAG: GTP cyclohydrolase 1 [Chlamydiae bacterium]|nr:GTP cyclohydrolase 1 [Chlamydiota bacterium]
MTDPAITNYPTSICPKKLAISSEEKKELIEQKVREMLEILGLDLTTPSLSKTPSRVAKMFVDEVFSGLDPAGFPTITLQEQAMEPGEMILVKNISFISFCEHHLVPMVGRAHFAYLPQNKVIGLSKIYQVIRYFARRPQLQERLTAQIADSFALLLGLEDVAVAISANHHCVLVQGVEDRASETETTVLRGLFRSHSSLRQEFLMKVEREDG